MTTIAEHIGGPKHGYIPVNKREYQRSSLDQETRESLIVKYITEHEGQFIPSAELQEIGDYRSAIGLRGVLKRLELSGRIRIDKVNARRTRYFLPESSSKVAQEHLEKVAEEAKQHREQAKILAISLVDAGAWEFIKQYDKPDTANAVTVLKDFITFIQKDES